jgi:hypothetical protein
VWTKDEVVILVCGAGALFVAQSEFQAYACFLGLTGQISWFRRVKRGTNPGMWWACVVYASAWLWGLWIHWL